MQDMYITWIYIDQDPRRYIASQWVKPPPPPPPPIQSIIGLPAQGQILLAKYQSPNILNQGWLDDH